MAILLTGLVGLALSGLPAAAPPAPRLLWNASASAPIGLYSVSPGSAFRAGDLVVARTPAAVRGFAATRHYLPGNVPLVKRVAAVAPSTVCAIGPRFFIDGRFVATRLRRDGAGRRMPWWKGCRRLSSAEIILLMGDSQTSFDGRYFGPSNRSDVIGPAKLLWRH
jgi:conjugative transfer signal peptidase TraF